MAAERTAHVSLMFSELEGRCSLAARIVDTPDRSQGAPPDMPVENQVSIRLGELVNSPCDCGAAAGFVDRKRRRSAAPAQPLG